MICCTNSLSLLGHSTILDCNIIEKEKKKKKTLALGKIFKIVNIFTLLYG